MSVWSPAPEQLLKEKPVKKKIRSHKLPLNRETLRVLSSKQLQPAVGALLPDGSDRDNTCDNCAPSMPMICPMGGGSDDPHCGE
jgi:hypothetical protein